MQKMNGQITSKEAIIELWGVEFVKLSQNPRIVITEDAVFVQIRGELTLTDGTKSSLVKLREPNLQDMKNTDTVKGEVSKNAVMIASVCNIIDSSLDKIGGRDYVLLNEVCTAFLSDGQKTGETL